MVTCKNCNGLGKIEGPRDAPMINWSVKTCPTCSGEGKVPNHVGRWAKCPECNGWGETGPLILESTCPRCNGRGMLPAGRV